MCRDQRGAAPSGKLNMLVSLMMTMMLCLSLAPTAESFVQSYSSSVILRAPQGTATTAGACSAVARGQLRMSDTENDLRGKVAVVTGSSRGIGKGIAVTLGERGCTVYVTGRSAGGTTTDEASVPVPLVFLVLLEHEGGNQREWV